MALAVSKVKSEAQNAQATSEARIAEQAKLAAALEQNEQAAKASEKEMQQVQQAERQKGRCRYKTALAEKQAEIRSFRPKSRSWPTRNRKSAPRRPNMKSRLSMPPRNAMPKSQRSKTQIASQEAAFKTTNRIAVEGILAKLALRRSRRRDAPPRNRRSCSRPSQPRGSKSNRNRSSSPPRKILLCRRRAFSRARA